MEAGAPGVSLPPLLALAPVRLELPHGAGGVRDAFAWPVGAADSEAAAFCARLVADGALPAALEGAATRAVVAAASAWRAAVAAGRARRGAGPLLLDVRVDARAGRTRLRDRFLWDAADEGADPEAFAQRLADDLTQMHQPPGGDPAADAARARDAAAVVAEAALQVREACAAAWRGAPAAVASEASAAAALAAARGGGEAPPGRADWADWAPRLEAAEPLPPPGGGAAAPAVPRCRRNAQRGDGEDEEFSEQSGDAPRPKAKKPKKAQPPLVPPPPPPPPPAAGSSATSAASLAQRSAAAAAQLGLGPVPPVAGPAQRLGSLHGPPPPFALSSAPPMPALVPPPPPPLPPPLQQQPPPAHLAPHAAQLQALSSAFSPDERVRVMAALQNAKANGPQALATVLAQLRALAQARLAAGGMPPL